VTAYLDRHYGWRVDPDTLVFTPGIVPALNVICRAFSDSGDGIMTVTPVYPPFLEAPLTQGRVLQTIPARWTNGRWRLPLQEMEAAVTPRTRVLLFCHPHNPLGRAWEEDELAEVTAFCARHDILLCSDEIHCDLMLDERRHIPAAVAAGADGTRIVTLMAPSKTFNVPGLNLGFAVIPDRDLRATFVRAARGLFPLPGCFSVVAAEAAYRDADEWLDALLAYLRTNRDIVQEWVATRLPRVDTAHVEATFLSWLDVRDLDLDDPAAACERAGVGLSDGKAFGAPGFLRLNFGCPRNLLEEALRRVAVALG
jgi:cystathionine beta-lyase